MRDSFRSPKPVETVTFSTVCCEDLNMKMCPIVPVVSSPFSTSPTAIGGSQSHGVKILDDIALNDRFNIIDTNYIAFNIVKMQHFLCCCYDLLQWLECLRIFTEIPLII